jgi:hypothetical protein
MHIKYDIVNQNYIQISLCVFRGYAVRQKYNYFKIIDFGFHSS